MLECASLAGRYGRILIFDTETTGLSPSNDRIIQFSAAVFTRQAQGYQLAQQVDRLVALPPGRKVPPKIQALTGITDADLAQRGIPPAQLCREVEALLDGPDTLLLAYNAQFDLSFLYYTLARDGNPAVLRGKDKLDLLTVYRDRRAYPHRLENAVAAYGLGGEVHNSHRAMDDVLAAAAVMGAMAAEQDDFIQYINLFGYSQRYGISGRPIASVTYRPQGYEPGRPLYQAIPVG